MDNTPYNTNYPSWPSALFEDAQSPGAPTEPQQVSEFTAYVLNVIKLQAILQVPHVSQRDHSLPPLLHLGIVPQFLLVNSHPPNPTGILRSDRLA